MVKINQALRKLTVIVITGYQWLISPILGNCCRFHPSCSHYTKEAILRFGLGKGAALSLKRIFRCHPWHAGGIDPVPDK